MSALSHTPLRPPRAGHIGEQVYASMWQAAMSERWEEYRASDDDAAPIEMVLQEFRRTVEQRHATVAATVICWLGCSVGFALMRRAESEIAAGRWDEHKAYLLAWTLENRRVRHVNSGVRLIEYMLTPEEDRVQPKWNDESGISKLPQLSADDLEVVDHVMLWLPTERGQRFLRQCEKEIERLRDEERRRLHAEHLRLHGVPS